jgi:hypothetical protein
MSKQYLVHPVLLPAAGDSEAGDDDDEDEDESLGDGGEVRS